MVRNKLAELKIESTHYLGIPYFSNTGKNKNYGDNVLVGKGNAKEIALKTIEIANLEKIELAAFSSEDIYKFQKKHHLGIDCSGLACHLLNFYFGTKLNPRRTSADMLTSLPLSTEINILDATTGDLIRQKNGHHLLFIIEKIGHTINYIDSSLSGRGVQYGNFDITDKKFIHQGIFRLNS